MKAEIRKRLIDSANALERAQRCYNPSGHPAGAEIKDDPEGTIIVKMTDTIRTALVKTLRDAVNDAWRDIRVTIKSGWEGAGRQGTALAQSDDADGMSWTLVRWDDGGDLALHKSGGLLAGKWA